MHHGNKTNQEILALIASGILSVGDTVFSTNWNETLTYNGTVFQSNCSSRYIGTYPICGDTRCPPVTEAIGSFTDLGL